MVSGWPHGLLFSGCKRRVKVPSYLSFITKKAITEVAGEMSTKVSNLRGRLGSQILEFAAAHRSRPPRILSGNDNRSLPLKADEHLKPKSDGHRAAMIIDGYSPSHLPYSDIFCSENSNFKVFDTCREGISFPAFATI